MDKILAAFLERQREEAQALADASDLLDIDWLDPQHCVARLDSKTLVRGPDGEIREVTGYEIGYWFREDYLRHVDPLAVLTWLGPPGAYHPNAKPPLVCIGPITPGTPLVDLIYRSFEVISCQNVMPDESDALNRAACQWARHSQHRFPLDDRPLSQSRKVLVQAGTVARPAGWIARSRSVEAGGELHDGFQIMRKGSAPIMVENIDAVVRINNPHLRHAIALDSQLARLDKLFPRCCLALFRLG
jgi:hypothetical protein